MTKHGLPVDDTEVCEAALDAAEVGEAALEAAEAGEAAWGAAELGEAATGPCDEERELINTELGKETAAFREPLTGDLSTLVRL